MQLPDLADWHVNQIAVSRVNLPGALSLAPYGIHENKNYSSRCNALGRVRLAVFRSAGV